MAKHSEDGVAQVPARPSGQGPGGLRRDQEIRAARESRAKAARRDAHRIVGDLLAQETDVARLGDLVIAIQRGFRADSCAFLYLDPLGTSCLTRASLRHPRPGRASTAEISGADQEITVDSVFVANSDRPLDLLRGNAMVACLHAYVRSLGTDRLFGILSIQHRTRRKFGAGDVALLDAIGDLLAAALGRAFGAVGAVTREEQSARHNLR